MCTRVRAERVNAHTWAIVPGVTGYTLPLISPKTHVQGGRALTSQAPATSGADPLGHVWLPQGSGEPRGPWTDDEAGPLVGCSRRCPGGGTPAQE